MFCQKCGSELSDGATFCTKCGTPVVGGAVPAGQTAAPAKKKNTILILIVAGVVALGFLFMLAIIAAIAIPDFLSAKDRAKFATCGIGLVGLKAAEEIYMVGNNKYTANPDALASNLIPGCKKQDGSDCKGRVMQKLETECKAGSVKLEVTPDGVGYRLKGIANTRNACAICITPMGAIPSSYMNCEPTFKCLQ